MTLPTWVDGAPRCHLCGFRWHTLYVPTANELLRNPDEPPYWKCGLCGNVWPLTEEERVQHAEAMKRTRESGIAPKAVRQRQDAYRPRHAKRSA